MSYAVKINGREVTRDELARLPSRLDEILESGQAPGLRTSNTFCVGNTNGSQFADDPALGDFYARELRARGGSPHGKTYKHSLARRPGDWRAWVADDGDVARICRQENWSCPQVGVKRVADNDEGLPVTGLGEDIIRNEIESRVEADPGLGAKLKKNPQKLQELREAVIEEHTPPSTKELVKNSPKPRNKRKPRKTIKV